MEKSGVKWCKEAGMLLGNYPAKINFKGRTAIPAKYRSQLGKKIILGQWYENCLVIVSQNQWQELLKQIEQKPFISAPSRETDRFLVGGAFEIEPDNQGRFVIPSSLREYAGLKGEVVFVGLLNRLEIWDKTKWEKHQKYLDEHAEEIAEKLSGVGEKE
jgi:MraZ protein